MEPRTPPTRAVIESAVGVHTAEFNNLSQREEQVLSYAAAGYIDKQIGQHLGVSVNTLRTYWQRIRSKLGEAPRSALAAAYVTHIASVTAPAVSQPFSPDWEIDFTNNRFMFLSDRPHPQRYLHGASLEEVISTYVEEEQPALRRLVQRLRNGELDAVYLTGRFNTPSGEGKASVYIQVVRDSEKNPIKMLGRRVPLIELSAPAETLFDWELDLTTNMVTRLTSTWLPHPVAVNDSIPLENVIENYHPEDQPKLRALMVSAHRGQLNSFSFSGRVVTESGIVPTGAFVQTEVDDFGKPSKLLGRRSLSFPLGGESGLIIGVGSITRKSDGEELVVDPSIYEVFKIPATEKDIVGAIARQLAPEQVASFRNLIRQILQAKVDTSGATYLVQPPEGDPFWVRFEFHVTPLADEHSGLTGTAIMFR